MLLRKNGYPFRVISSTYRERLIKGVSPQKLVRIHAVGKVRKAIVPPAARWILGADTAVVYRKHILGKPRNLKNAARMLGMLQGRLHFVYSGVALYDRRTGEWKTAVVRTRVRIKKMTALDIDRYLNRIDPLDKAGAYGIQESPKIVESIEGSYTNVVGLPMEVIRGFMLFLKRKPSRI